MANKFYSPLRYPGGKTRLAPFIKQLIVENRLVGCDYIEPYAGGAGVALSLLFEEYVDVVTINDYDRSIYAFWHSILNNDDDFCQKIQETSVTVENWQQQKKIQSEKSSQNLFDLGFSTFFLNRTNISGIIKGGVIGGIKQDGKYKIDARFNKESLINRIKKIAKYRQRIQVTNYDALKILNSDLSNSFVYLDPPYEKKSKDLYINTYNEKDHSEIAKTLLANKHTFYWIVSYDKSELIANLYQKCKKRLSWSMNYGTSHGLGDEYLFINKKLKVDISKNLLCPYM